MISEEDPQKEAEVDNTEDAEDGHTETGMVETQDEHTRHHKGGTSTEIRASTFLTDDLRGVETVGETAGRKQRAPQVTSGTIKQPRSTVLGRDNKGNPIIRAEYGSD